MSVLPARRCLLGVPLALWMLIPPDIGASARIGEKSVTTLVRVNLVLNISDIQIQTDRSGILLCTDAAMRRDLSFYMSRHLPASLAFDEATRAISAVGSAPIDRLLAVSDDSADADLVSVQLMKRPTLLYLSRTNPRFAELLALLRSAVGLERSVAVGVLPAGQLIEDVRIDDWPR